MPLTGRVLRRGQLLAAHGQFFQLGGGLVDGGLHFEQTGRPGGTAVREMRPEHVAFGGDGGEVRAAVDEVLGVFERADEDDPAQQAPYGGHEVGGGTDQVGGERVRCGPWVVCGCVVAGRAVPRAPLGRCRFVRRSRQQQSRPARVLLAQQPDGVGRGGR